MERHVSKLTRNTLAVILAGGRGARLKGLTRWRAKPAVPFGGQFRIVDFPLSNCVNSGLRRIQVMTQYKAHSLIRHVQAAWGYLRSDHGEFVELVPAQQRNETGWYAGTADAVFQNLDIIRRHGPGLVLLLAGDHIYKMDYGPMLAAHVRAGADVTVGCIEVPIEDACRFGVMSVSGEGDGAARIVRFDEKPETPCPIPGRPDKALASMGIYVFDAGWLYEALLSDARIADSTRDFGGDIIPAAVHTSRVISYPFVGPTSGPAYWRDVGTVDAYWQANMELVRVIPPMSLYEKDWKIWSFMEQLPPAKFVFDDDDRRGMAVDSLVSAGCVISGARLRRSLVSTGGRVHSYCTIEDSVLLPDVDIGRHCTIKRAVIGKRCVIPPGTTIGVDPVADAERFHVTEGGVVLVVADDLR